MSVIDVYKLKHNNITQGATYINPKNIAQSSRIDYIFAEKTLVQYITSCDVKTTPAPDHRAIIINISKQKSVRGPSYWKL